MIAALLRALRGRPAAVLAEAQDDDSPAFVNGLALGALVGAAIAGSTLWRRFRAGSRQSGNHPGAGQETRVTD